MIVIDATKLENPRNADEVLALYIHYADVGDTITLHAPKCATTRNGNRRCNCQPTTLVVGAKA